MARRAKSRGRKARSPQKGFFLKREKEQQTMTTSKFKYLVRKSGEIYVLLGVLVILLVFVAVTFYLITKDSRNEQEWIRLSTDLQVQSHQFAKSASEAIKGSSSAFLDLSDSRSMISSAMTSLKNGDSDKSLPALPTSLSVPLDELSDTWNHMSTNVAKILKNEFLVHELVMASSEFMQAIPKIQTLTDTQSGLSPEEAHQTNRYS